VNQTDFSLQDAPVKIILKPGKGQSVKRLHPWIFSGAIARIEGKPHEGDVAEVFSHDREYLATGHYQVGSIAVRIFSFQQVVADMDFWKQTILNAFDLRKALKLTHNKHTNVYRLVNGEGDGLPGLIVDYYNGILVMQFHSIGLYRIREIIAGILMDIYGREAQAVYDKSEGTLPFKANLGAKNEFLFGNLSKTGVCENDCLFNVDVTTGQKTGFFIDQRENRKLLGTYAEGKKVLNMFCYTGGFSVYAVKAGAALIHSVDSSSSALRLTEENIRLNSPDSEHHSTIMTDAFDYLKDIRDMYDVIILDPPAFAKHQEALNNALMGYKRLNAKAIEQIRKKGILFTFSCSQVVSRDEFRKSVFAAAANSGRSVRILHQLTQPPDHPVSIYHPEGEYLKGLVLQVE
jgi:23S rRNA (cytosine1962-C5)-methyltransferase